MNGNTKKIALALFLALLILGVGRYLMPQETAGSKDEAVTKAVLSQNWKVSSLGANYIVLKVPSALRQIPTKLDDKAKEVLESYDSYEYTEGTFGMRINCITAKTDLSAENYANQLSSMIKSSPDISGYSSKISPFEKGTMSGSLIKGMGRQNGTEVDMNSVIIVNGTRLWEVSISFNSADEQLKELAIEVFDSIEIK